MVIYELQRESADGEWEALGLSRGTAAAVDIDEAVAAMRATCALPPGTYRVRAVEEEHRWHFGEVDATGAFRLIDQPPSEQP